ncbi:MAG: LEA type 2 family protein [Dysgonamonadaceae bacterium]|nr:LEA type 2 family protein [Dysgonamonadaceae bacterium]MDD3899767.1 LEA type 2 family protein [Dysgonamonadaceae bacterium]MDD4397954.1 LEA type 2 family protein [Dysgonamonadaceae bacterium]MEA5080191.1 LEA type 2 family protein [Dysgonamonadaceae bacterium]
MKKVIALFTLVIFLQGCNVLNQIGGAYNLSQCEFKYKSIDNIQLAGVDLGNTSSISVTNLAKISTILSGGQLQTIPFNMVLNMDVKNPNEFEAFLNALDYVVEINDLEFVVGKLNTPIRIAAGGSGVLPIPVAVDLRNLMNRYSKEKVNSVMSSFLGISSDKTKVTVKLWPTIMIGEAPLKSPAAIPVVFTFGGK